MVKKNLLSSDARSRSPLGHDNEAPAPGNQEVLIYPNPSVLLELASPILPMYSHHALTSQFLPVA